MLDGLKTYVVVAVAILSALLGYYDGQLTLLQAGQAIGLALGLGGNRAVVWAGQVLNAPYRTAGGDTPNPKLRQLVTYAGVALSILTAVLAAANGEQSSASTIGVILGAVGLNFLGIGSQKAALGEAPPRSSV